MRGQHRKFLPSPLCAYCAQPLAWGAEYWYINGAALCGECLADYARGDYESFRHILGEEKRHDAL